MSEQIQIGDLVVCVKTCCQKQSERHVGKIRQVVAMQHDTTYCRYCGLEANCLHLLAETSMNGSPHWWCKRIPPLSELEGVNTEEDIREPA